MSVPEGRSAVEAMSNLAPCVVGVARNGAGRAWPWLAHQFREIWKREEGILRTSMFFCTTG